MNKYKNATKDINGFIAVNVTDKHIAAAKNIRMERDMVFSNLFSENETDQRWVGDLGEIIFNYWLDHHFEDKTDFKWLFNDPAANSDFLILGCDSIGVKTVKRKGKPLPHYTAQVSGKHVEEPSDHFFFMSYDFNSRVMWLLGGIQKDRFLDLAKFYGAGDKVHDNYRIRDGHSIYNIEIDELTRPDEWLANLQY